MNGSGPLGCSKDNPGDSRKRNPVRGERGSHPKSGRSPLCVSLMVAALLGLGGCASMSSVDRLRATARATNARLAHIEFQQAGLARELRTLRAHLESEIRHIQTTQTLLATRLASTKDQARTALMKARQADEAMRVTRALNSASSSAAHASGAWLFNKVLNQARRLAGEAYVPPARAPAAVRAIGPAADRPLDWHGVLPGWPTTARLQLAFDPDDARYDQAVAMYVVADKHILPITLNPGDFNLPSSLSRKLPSRLPAAGFSVVSRRRDHVPYAFLSFLGASYFRARGWHESWGDWSRAVSLDTAVPNRREEFPSFRDFWIVMPSASARTLTVVALLDGSSVTGAFRFRATPGPDTRIRVTAALFLRRPVHLLGVAPLVSMYLRGRMRPAHHPRLHPSVHYADGLSFETGNRRWAWSPLIDPRWPNVRTFPLPDPRRFGLVQRDRSFQAYQAAQADYQQCPNVWIDPHGHWGNGRLELVELPSHRATNANVVTFWVPRTPPPPQKPLVVRYTIRFGERPSIHPSRGYVQETRETPAAHDRKVFTVYFRGGRLDRIPAWIRLEPAVTLRGRGRVRDVSLVKLPTLGLWRLRYTVPNRPGLIVKAWIRYHNKPLTEIWTYEIPRRF